MQSCSISFRSYAIDLWGFGDSSKCTRYSVEHQAQLLDRFLEEMGIGKVALVGHGLGAVVALKFAASQPQLVDRVMAVGYPAGFETLNNRLLIADPVVLGNWLLGSAPGAEAARMETAKADPKAIAQSLKSLQGLNLWALIHSLPLACLLVHGQKDPAMGLPGNELLATLPEQNHYLVFEASGHFPMLDEQNKFNRLLVDFLNLKPGESPRQLQLKAEWKRRVR